jgi:hypothetical protein
MGSLIDLWKRVSSTSTVLTCAMTFGVLALPVGDAKAGCTPGNWTVTGVQSGHVMTFPLEIRVENGRTIFVGDWNGPLRDSHSSGESFSFVNSNNWGTTTYQGSCAGAALKGTFANTMGGAGTFTGALVSSAATPPTRQGNNCPGDAKSYVSIVPVHHGAYRLRNTCAHKVIKLSWLTSGGNPTCKTPMSNPGSDHLQPGGSTSVFSDCGPPQLLQASFAP